MIDLHFGVNFKLFLKIFFRLFRTLKRNFICSKFKIKLVLKLKEINRFLKIFGSKFQKFFKSRKKES